VDSAAHSETSQLQGQQTMKLKRDTWMLLGVLGLVAGYAWFMSDKAKRAPREDGAKPASIVPLVPSEKKNWEAREKMMPLVNRIANDPSLQHPSNTQKTPEPSIAPLTQAEKEALYERLDQAAERARQERLNRQALPAAN